MKLYDVYRDFGLISIESFNGNMTHIKHNDSVTKSFNKAKKEYIALIKADLNELTNQLKEAENLKEEDVHSRECF